MKRLLAAAAAFSCACVPYPEGAPPPESGGTTIVRSAFQGLDAGASQLDSLHFRVFAYGPDQAKAISAAVEDDYQKTMIDTNLFSFMPSSLYQVVVYNDRAEYLRKSGQPEWSGGVTVGNAVYTFNGANLNRTLAHELTHVIFFEFMQRFDPAQRWVNEGLAVYEEQKAAGAINGGAADIFGAVRPTLKQQPVPLDQMINLAPATERQYAVSLWYAEAESMVRYMIDKGGRLGFSQFLEQLKEGQTLDHAVNSGFGSNWRDLNDFYQDWQRNAP